LESTAGGGVGWEVDGVEGFGAAEADGGVFFFFAYVGDVAPTAVALGDGGDRHAETDVWWGGILEAGRFSERNVRDTE
jgi:hypothetical protein